MHIFRDHAEEKPLCPSGLSDPQFACVQQLAQAGHVRGELWQGKAVVG
jgi:hypothetical protein